MSMPCRRWSMRRPAGAHVVQPDGGRRRAGSVPATRTCKTSRSARSWGARFARLSCPRRAGDLLTADYSQIELRLLAHFCGDEALAAGFRRGSRHSRPGRGPGLRRRAKRDVTADMRRMAKTVNFGVIYGISAFGLAVRLEIAKNEAAAFIDAYFARYPRVLAYQEKLLEDCRQRRLREHDPRPPPRHRRNSCVTRPTRAATSPSAKRSTCRFKARPPT